MTYIDGDGAKEHKEEQEKLKETKSDETWISKEHNNLKCWVEEEQITNLPEQIEEPSI